MSARRKRGFAVAVPDPADFKGRPLRAFLVATTDFLRLLVAWLGVDPAGRPLILIGYTAVGGITARSSTTMGSGTVNVVKWDGTNLSNSGNGTITAYNVYGGAFSGSKYVVCVLVWGVYIAIGVEC